MRIRDQLYGLAWGLVTLCVALLALATIFARVAQGQDTPVIFQHGVVSSGKTWDETASVLAQSYRILPLLPTLAWYRREQDQSDQLAGLVDDNPSAVGIMPIIGHSNGGIVAREYSRRGGRTNAFMTIGTPHRGAPAANAWMSGMVRSNSDRLASWIASPLLYYYAHDPEVVIPPGMWAAGGLFAGLFWNIGNFICGGVGICVSAASDLVVPVVKQLSTDSSSYITVLNSGGNLAAEQGRLTSRVSASTVFQPVNTMCYMLTTAGAFCVMARVGAIATYLSAYQHYADDWDDPDLQENSYRWIKGAAALIDMDAVWQSWIGALVSYHTYVDGTLGVAYSDLAVVPSDGFLPEYAVMYPYPTRPHLGILGNTSHTMQTHDGLVRRSIAGWFLNDLRIPVRQPGVTSQVRIEPTEVYLQPGQSVQLVATAYDELGDVVRGRTFTWATTDSMKARLSANGVVTALGFGVAYVRASADGAAGSSTVTVTMKTVQ